MQIKEEMVILDEKNSSDVNITETYNDPLTDSVVSYTYGKADPNHYARVPKGIYNKLALVTQFTHSVGSLSNISKVWGKKEDTFKNWPLMRDRHFLSYPHETLCK